MDESGEVHILKCEPLPDYLDKETQSWDCSFEAGINNDYVAGQHWGKRGSKSYALRYVMEKMDFVPTEKAVKEMASFFQIVPSKILVEKAGNGPAVISSLSARIPGIVGIDPRGSKRARASAYSPVVEAGNCYLPHPDIAPWTLKFIENMAVFPNGLHDDDTDSWSQAMNYLYGKSRQVSPVFAMEFEENIHVSRKPLRPVQGLRAFRFWHGGMSPVCMIGQQSRRGGVVLYHCLQAEGMGIEEFIRMRVMPILNEFYPWPLEWVDIGPPSMIMSNQKDPSVQERPAEIIERLLRTTFTQGTKDWSTRREASKEIFNRRSGLLINCERTPGESGHYLLEAVRDDYGYEIDETTKQVKKDAPYDKVPAYAVGEALTFGLSYLYAPPLQGIPRSSGKKEMQKRAASYATD